VGVQHLAVDIGDPALAEQPRDLAAAAVTQVRQQTDQLHRRPFRACTTLKPWRCARVSTWSKPLPRAASYGRCRLATSHSEPPGAGAAAATLMKARPRSGRSALPCPWNGGLLTITS